MKYREDFLYFILLFDIEFNKSIIIQNNDSIKKIIMMGLFIFYLLTRNGQRLKIIPGENEKKTRTLIKRYLNLKILQFNIIYYLLVISMIWGGPFFNDSCAINHQNTCSTLFQYNWCNNIPSKSEFDNTINLNPIQYNDNISMKIEVSEQYSEEVVIIKKKIIAKKQKKRWNSKKHIRQKKLNIRNIIPNLARKILSYLCSEKSRQFLSKHYPNLSNEELEKFYQYTNINKSSLTFYIGNKDLKRIWYSDQAPAFILHLTRVLSKNFLNNECVSSILLSRRMKPALKIEHLHYRKKILRLLEGYKYKNK